MESSRSGASAHRSSSTRAVVPPVLKHLPAHRPPRPRSPEHSQPQTHEQPLTRRESGSGAVTGHTKGEKGALQMTLASGTDTISIDTASTQKWG